MSRTARSEATQALYRDYTNWLYRGYALLLASILILAITRPNAAHASRYIGVFILLGIIWCGIIFVFVMAIRGLRRFWASSRADRVG